MSHGLSDALESSIREYSKYLLELPQHKVAAELEFLQHEMHDHLDKQSRDVRRSEQPVIQLLHFLTEAHGKTAIINLGIDPFSMQPIVRIDGDEMMF